jgi:hypothetical protein
VELALALGRPLSEVEGWTDTELATAAAFLEARHG